MEKEKKQKKKLGNVAKSVGKEFVDFIKKGNALSMAIGVIIGSAFSAIVTSINKDVLMPFIGALFGKQDFSSLYLPLWNAEKVIVDGVVQLDQYGNELYTSAIYYGRLIQSCIDFLLIALVLFLVLKITNSIMNRIRVTKEKLAKKEPETVEEVAPAPAPIPADIQLLTEIRDLLKEEKTKETT